MTYPTANASPAIDATPIATATAKPVDRPQEAEHREAGEADHHREVEATADRRGQPLQQETQPPEQDRDPHAHHQREGDDVGSRRAAQREPGRLLAEEGEERLGDGEPGEAQQGEQLPAGAELARRVPAANKPSPDRSHTGSVLTPRSPSPARGQTIRRSVAQRVSSWRLLSWSLRSTADTWVSTVFTDSESCRAISLYV